MNASSLLNPHGPMSSVEVVLDLMNDNQRRLTRYLKRTDEDCLHWKPDPEANSIAVTLWHMARIVDVFLTQLVRGQTAEEEVWFQRGWSERTGYDPRGAGHDGWGAITGYSQEEVVTLPHLTRDQLTGYLDEVYACASQFLSLSTPDTIAEAAPGFGGRYTVYQVLTMALMDNVRHTGEILALQEMWKRANRSE
jgi:hypothetical protein